MVVKVVLESGGHGKKGINVDSFSNTLYVTFPGVTELLEQVDGHKGHFFYLGGLKSNSWFLLSWYEVFHIICHADLPQTLQMYLIIQPSFSSQYCKYTLESDPHPFKMGTAHYS